MEGDGAFRAIVEHVADGVVVVTADGEVLYANPAASAILGEEHDTLVGDRFGYPLSDGQETEIDLLRPQGERRVAEMRTARIDWDGDPAYVAAVRDVTSRVATEQALRDVVSTVSHEVRSPLAVVDGFVEMLLGQVEQGELDGAVEEPLRNIDVQVTRVERLADDLLTFARLDAGELKPSAEEIDIAGLLAEICDEYAAQGVELEAGGADGLAVWADPHHVRRIVDNYVSNASKYGDPPIHIEVEREDRDVVLRVVDEGAGVPRELRPRLFERFSRGDDVRASGSGLGLPIVLGLARAAGGDAWYEGGEGGGAVFAVRLPCPPD